MSDLFLNKIRGGTTFVTSSTAPKQVVQSTLSTNGQGTDTTNNPQTATDNAVVAPSLDTRVRLRAMKGQETQVYGDEGDDDNILSILHETTGLMFPYTPTIGVSQSVDYKTVDLVHTIGDISTYNHTPSVTLSVTADFSVQNQREGRYALAALHFLRTVSKMYFGETDAKASKAGLPPPVLIFTGYGNYMFNNLPVILKSHNYSLDKNMNMISISTASGLAKLPAFFSVSLELQVQQTPQAMRKEFSLDAFRTGALLRAGGDSGWI